MIAYCQVVRFCEEGTYIFDQLITKKLEYIQVMIPHHVFITVAICMYKILHSGETVEQNSPGMWHNFNTNIGHMYISVIS